MSTRVWVVCQMLANCCLWPVYTSVYQYTHMLMSQSASGWYWMSSWVAFHITYWDRSLIKPRAHKVSWTDWLLSFRDPHVRYYRHMWPCLTFSVWNLKPSLHAREASPLPTELSPQPLTRHCLGIWLYYNWMEPGLFKSAIGLCCGECVSWHVLSTGNCWSKLRRSYPHALWTLPFGVVQSILILSSLMRRKGWPHLGFLVKAWES